MMIALSWLLQPSLFPVPGLWWFQVHSHYQTVPKQFPLMAGEDGASVDMSLTQVADDSVSYCGSLG